ncbi:MAG: HAD-IA family hydrolase [Paracoccaceae bacterium]
MTPELVIFDCDGVLIDSETIACAVDAEELSRCGSSISTAEIVERYAGMSQAAMYADLRARLDMVIPDDIDERIEARVMERYRSELKPIEGVAKTLATFPWRFCVASSSKPARLALGLIETGLFELFYPFIYSTSLVIRGKPSPDLFLLAAKQMGVQPEHCVVVEDSVAGIAAALAAGMCAVGFIGGSHHTQLSAERLQGMSGGRVVQRFEDIAGQIIRL